MKSQFYLWALAVITLTLAPLAAVAEEEIPQEIVAPETVFSELAKPDSVTGATIKVVQNEQLANRMEHQKLLSTSATQKGYRVQLFSSNKSQSARETAFNIEKNILAKLPNLEVYVMYNAPFWKVRAGNCLTNEDAQLLRETLVAEFPEYQSEMYIVPDKIILK